MSDKKDRSMDRTPSRRVGLANKNGPVPFFLMVTAFASCGNADAHGLYLSVRVEGTSIVGRAYYEGELPAKKAIVRVETMEGEPVVEMLTDESGRFRRPMPYRADYNVIVETADLHEARAILKESDFPEEMQSLKVDPTYKRMAEQTIQEQFASAKDIDQMREQLDRIETAIRLRDVLGGVGIIIGVLAIVYFMKQQWQ